MAACLPSGRGPAAAAWRAAGVDRGVGVLWSSHRVSSMRFSLTSTAAATASWMVADVDASRV
eukprot:1146314-Pyramimonas_sp.AAC.1